MNYRLLAIGTLCTLTSVVACGDDDETTATTTTTSGTTSSGMGGMASSSSSGMGGTGGMAPETSLVRVGHLSPNAPAVDFCLIQGDGTPLLGGPVLEALGDADGFSYKEFTTYVEIPAGTYDVGIVAADATDCMPATLLYTQEDLPVPGNIEATALAVGLFPGSFALALAGDDNSDPAAGKGKLRFYHAAPDVPAVDVGVGTGELTGAAILFDNVSYPGNATPPYLEADPLSNVTVRVQLDSMGTTGFEFSGISLPAGAVATAFAVGTLDANDAAEVEAIVCVDNDGAGNSCTVVSAD